MSNLPLEDIVNIIVNLGPRAAVRRGFNLALLVGTSEIISPEERVRLYSNTDAMFEDGFRETDPEYIGARLMFSQNPRPGRVAIGRRVTLDSAGEFEVTSEAAATGGNFIINWEHVAEGGNTFLYYTPFDLSVVPEFGDVLASPWEPITTGQEITPEPGATYIMVVEINAANQVVNIGAALLGGASVSFGLPVCESPTDAIRACRAINTEWYAVSYLGATPDDVLSIAQYVEAVRPVSVQFYTTDEDLILSNNPESIFHRLRLKSFRRSIGQFSRTPFAVCGILGFAMGANTRLSRSAYTLMHKRVVGIVPDDITLTQVTFLQRQNGNYYVSRGAEYFMFERGTMADGVWFDEIINLDMLVNDMQLAILDLFVSRPKVPQTEGGMNDIKIAMGPSLRRMAMIGFIAPGRWNGPNIYTEPDYAPLQTGDMLETGYMILSEPIDYQSQAGRDARIAPPIYVAIKLAGAIHHVTVRIDVNR